MKGVVQLRGTVDSMDVAINRWRKWTIFIRISEDEF